LATKRKVSAPEREPKRELVWTEAALRGLEEIRDYIALDSAAAADRWIDGLIAVAERATTSPFAGRRVPELGREDVREVLKGNYRLVYRVTPHHVEVLTVFEGHRLFPKQQ
jgi:plasmid stabilization system protein ParE